MGKASIAHFRSVLASHRPVCSLVNEDMSSMGVSVSEPSFGSSGTVCVQCGLKMTVLNFPSGGKYEEPC